MPASQVANANPAKRRRLIGPDGQELFSGGLPKPVIDAAMNLNCRLLVHHLHMALFFKFGFDITTVRYNIDQLGGLTAVIWTLYIKAKQEANNMGRAKDKIKGDDDITLNGKSFKFDHLATIFTEVCTLYGLTFGGRGTGSQMRGNFQANLSLFYAQKFRCQEGLYITNTFRKQDLEREGDCSPVSQWGVKRPHWHLMYGGNFTPSMRSSLLQQMGPGTILVTLSEQSDERFQKKWRDAAVAQMSGVPHIEAACGFIQGKSHRASDLIKEVLDIAAFSVHRQAHKRSFSWGMLLPVMKAHAAFAVAYAGIKDKQVPMQSGSEEAVIPGVDVGAKLTAAAFPPEILKMDWSGKGFWYLYNQVAKHSFDVFAKDATHADTYSQWLSLAVTGMWGEDKAILKFMFDKEFKSRSQYGEAFKGRKATGTTVAVHLLPVKNVAKLASAAQTDLGAQDSAIDIRHAVVSGKAVSVWKDNDKRGALLSTRDVVEVSMLGGVNGISEALRKHKQIMEKRILSKGKIEYGTTPWYKVTTASSMDCYGELLEGHVVQLEDKNIFSRDD